MESAAEVGDGGEVGVGSGDRVDRLFAESDARVHYLMGLILDLIREDDVI